MACNVLLCFHVEFNFSPAFLVGLMMIMGFFVDNVDWYFLLLLGSG